MGLSKEQIADLAIEGLKAIATLIGGATGKSIADVLTAVDVIVDGILRAASDDSVDPNKIRDEIQKLVEGVQANDAKADKALRDKFDPNKDPKKE